VTSSIKPEVHNVSQHRSHGHRGSAQQILGRLVQWFQRYAHGQTDTQTDSQADRQTDRNTPLPYWGAVITAEHHTVSSVSQMASLIKYQTLPCLTVKGSVEVQVLWQVPDTS